MKKKTKNEFKSICKKILYFILTFIFGVIVSSIFHAIIDNNKVRTTAESICTVFARDENECKNGIDNILNIADNEMQNSMGGEKGE